jgi:predicted enzyme related to lactoylglutathione lyase
VALQRLDNVLIVVEDLEAVKAFFVIMFAVDLDDVLRRLRARGAELVGEVVQYQDLYRLCYVRGPEGILVGLAKQLR